MNSPSNARSTSPQVTYNGKEDEEPEFIEANQIGSAKGSCSDDLVLGSIRGDVYFRVGNGNNMVYHPSLKTFPERTQNNSITTSQEALIFACSYAPKLLSEDETAMRISHVNVSKKAPELFIRRFEKCGYVLWDELSVLEKQMVDYNPAFFSISIVPPEMVEARVDLLSSVVNVEEVDVTGKSGKLRRALDEDVAWMTDSEYVFSRYKEDIRECAVMAFLPPRCFIFCDNEGSENDERLLNISCGLRTAVQRESCKERVEIRPGALLVGLRMRIYMRVIALESDVHHPTRVRCVCVDYNAIYSFEHHELFNVPREFSPKNIPINAFLGRFRGTYYVYQDKHEEVSNALCPLKNNEGTAEFAMCAIFGTAPDEYGEFAKISGPMEAALISKNYGNDLFLQHTYTCIRVLDRRLAHASKKDKDGLLIIDTCMGKSEEWVSDVLIRTGITAPMGDNLEVELSPGEARKMWKERIRRRHDQRKYLDCTAVMYEDTSAKMFANERRYRVQLMGLKILTALPKGIRGELDFELWGKHRALSSYIRTCRTSKMSPHVTAVIDCMVMNTITAACQLLKGKQPDTPFEGALVNELLSEPDTMITSALEEMKHLSFD
ncbi:unnamed protein product [Angiostrongylus costaricensis]|uniref:SET domain-containing protein n=1 Tax=Angiostrongylus costaricensis TaxID=334426 RepID=A0A158PIN9_ANGCS|nr:unnamed protein product [Angiostrongylus costaricensis]